MYDQIEDIINTLCIKHRLNKKLVEEAIDHTFKEIKSKITSDEYPSVLVHNWGRFKINRRYMYHKIKGIANYIIQNNPRVEYYDRLRILIKAYKRICEEENIEWTEDLIIAENLVKDEK